MVSDKSKNIAIFTIRYLPLPKNAATLIELIIAIALLSLILLTGVTINISSRKLFNVSSRQAELQDEVNPALLKIKKDINMAIGHVNNAGIIIESANSRFRARVNTGTDSIPFTADDQWVAYELNANQILYLTPHTPWVDWPSVVGGEEIASNRITTFNINEVYPDYDNDGFADSTFVMGADIAITACYDISGACDGTEMDNYVLSLATSVHCLSQPAK